tara:strand:+ start:449 stop:610 length:162 start_codon:yes stop_codon:yes gene_type:complete
VSLFDPLQSDKGAANFFKRDIVSSTTGTMTKLRSITQKRKAKEPDLQMELVMI